MEDNRPTISIYSLTPLDKTLRDRRLSTMNCNLGRIDQLAAQYGVEVSVSEPDAHLLRRAARHKKKLQTCYKYTAPKQRLQQLIEKFHFSLTKYSRRPYFR